MIIRDVICGKYLKYQRFKSEWYSAAFEEQNATLEMEYTMMQLPSLQRYRNMAILDD